MFLIANDIAVLQHPLCRVNNTPQDSCSARRSQISPASLVLFVLPFLILVTGSFLFYPSTCKLSLHRNRETEGWGPSPNPDKHRLKQLVESVLAPLSSLWCLRHGFIGMPHLERGVRISVGLFGYIIMVWLVVCVMSTCPRLLNAPQHWWLECTPVCAAHAILAKLVWSRAATEGGCLVHFFAIQIIPDKYLVPIWVVMKCDRWK